MLDALHLFPEPLIADAARLITALRAQGATIAFAESCTGGLVSALLTSIAGASDVLGFGFVTYSNDAKTELLGVPRTVLEQHGAVSPQVAAAMADGARNRSRSTLALAVTGIAGPDGGTPAKPVGLVYIGLATADGPARTREFRFGDIGRSQVRLQSTVAAIAFAREAVTQ